MKDLSNCVVINKSTKRDDQKYSWLSRGLNEQTYSEPIEIKIKVLFLEKTVSSFAI